MVSDSLTDRCYGLIASPQSRAMLIVCPTCATSYQIEPAALGAAGRSVRCAHCKNTWFATAESMVEEAALAPVRRTAAASTGRAAAADDSTSRSDPAAEDVIPPRRRSAERKPVHGRGRAAAGSARPARGGGRRVRAEIRSRRSGPGRDDRGAPRAPGPRGAQGPAHASCGGSPACRC